MNLAPRQLPLGRQEAPPLEMTRVLTDSWDLKSAKLTVNGESQEIGSKFWLYGREIAEDFNRSN